MKVQLHHLVLLFLSIPIALAHTDERASSTIGLPKFLAIVSGISVLTVIGLYIIKKQQTFPEMLPMKKVSIAVVVTIVVNTLILGFLYVEV